MQIIKGHVNQGRFTPENFSTLPNSAQAVLILNEFKIASDLAERIAWLKELNRVKADFDVEEVNFYEKNNDLKVIESS